MMAGDEDKESTYIIDPESGAEMARLIEQARYVNEAMGDMLPRSVDLNTVHAILDVACGPGGWAQEVAFLYPDIKVVGIDISQAMIQFAQQRAQVQRLDNASFYVMDARAPLPFSDGAFDLVNARLMAAFLPRAEWPQVIKEFARTTRSGGSIVLTETDICSSGNTNSPALEELNGLGREATFLAGLYSGTGTLVTSVLGQLLQEAGCRQVQHTWHALDFSAGTAAHQVVYANLSSALKLVQPFLLKMMPITQERLDDLYEKALQEMMSDDFRGYTHFLSTWGIRSAYAV